MVNFSSNNLDIGFYFQLINKVLIPSSRLPPVLLKSSGPDLILTSTSAGGPRTLSSHTEN